MAVYYKFKSAKDYESISIDGHFITVASLKEKIYVAKQLGRGTDYDLVVTNAQTNEEYLDEDMLIPKNTSVLIRRIPGPPRKPLVAAPVTEQAKLKGFNEPESAQETKSSFSGTGLSVISYLDGSDYDEFGNDLYDIPEVVPVMPNNQIHDAPAPSNADEDSKIQALIDTPALDWQQQNFDGFGAGRGFLHGMGGRMGARGFGRGGGFERKTPPPGYVCHRCKTPGHFIQHCPTNGDPNFDIKRVKPPTGIPKSMLMTTPDGSYALPSGAVAVLKPNEAAFEKEIEGMPYTRTVGDVPPELHCPLCKQVMKDAVLTSKCCFKSFCDKCIRNHVIEKSACVCGATNVLADDLVPNKTVRDTITRSLESNNSSAENGGNAYHVQEAESAKCAPPQQPKIASPTPSATSKREQTPPQDGNNTKMQSVSTEQDATPVIQQTASEMGKEIKAPNLSEAAYEAKRMMEPASQGGGRPVDDEDQQKQVPTEAVMKKKKKKVNTPISAAEMQWRASQEYAPENYMMPAGHNPYNPYCNRVQPGTNAFMGTYSGGMPYMGGYGFRPVGVPFGGMFPQDPFGSSGGLMMPPFIPPQRDLAELGMGMNCGGKEDGSTVKPKTRPIQPPSNNGHRHRTERSSLDRLHSRDNDPDAPPHLSKKRKSSIDRYEYDDYDDSHHHHHQHRSQQHKNHRRSEASSTRRQSQAPPSSGSKPVAAPEATAPSAASDHKHKRNAFSRISFHEEEVAVAAAASKKRKLPSSSSEAAFGGGTTAVSRKNSTNAAGAATAIDYESSDDDRYFKRRPLRYEPSPARDRARDRDRYHERHREHYNSKHRQLK